MVAATLMWIAESGRLREPLEYSRLFGEIVHSQTVLKYAYLKARSYQYCCVVHLESHQINHHQTSSLCEQVPQKHFAHLLAQYYI